jgi:hypothetical protein
MDDCLFFMNSYSIFFSHLFFKKHLFFCGNAFFKININCSNLSPEMKRTVITFDVSEIRVFHLSTFLSVIIVNIQRFSLSTF